MHDYKTGLGQLARTFLREGAFLKQIFYFLSGQTTTWNGEMGVQFSIVSR